MSRCSSRRDGLCAHARVPHAHLLNLLLLVGDVRLERFEVRLLLAVVEEDAPNLEVRVGRGRGDGREEVQLRELRRDLLLREEPALPPLHRGRVHVAVGVSYALPVLRMGREWGGAGVGSGDGTGTRVVCSRGVAWAVVRRARLFESSCFGVRRWLKQAPSLVPLLTSHLIHPHQAMMSQDEEDFGASVAWESGPSTSAPAPFDDVTDYSDDLPRASPSQPAPSSAPPAQSPRELSTRTSVEVKDSQVELEGTKDMFVSYLVAAKVSPTLASPTLDELTGVHGVRRTFPTLLRSIRPLAGGSRTSPSSGTT